MGRDGEGAEGGVLRGDRGQAGPVAVGDARGPGARGDLDGLAKAKEDAMMAELSRLREENARLRAKLVSTWGDA